MSNNKQRGLKMKKKLTLKYTRPTTNEHGHTKVFVGGVYVGYFMPNRSQAGQFGENYNFESMANGVEGFNKTFHTTSYNTMIDKLNKTFLIK